MWILNFLPDIVFHLMLIVGLAGIVISFFLGHLPLVNQYKLPLQIISIIVTIVAIWYEGGIAKDKEYRAEIERMKEKVTIAEQKAKDANGKIEYVFKDRVKVVKETQVVVQEKIKDISVKIDSQCKIIPEVIETHNQAAKRPGVKK